MLIGQSCLQEQDAEHVSIQPSPRTTPKLMTIVLWDIGTYRIDPIKADDDSDSEEEKRRKRRRTDHPTIESEDPYVPNMCRDASDAMRLIVRIGWVSLKKTSFELGIIGIRVLARQEASISLC